MASISEESNHDIGKQYTEVFLGASGVRSGSADGAGVCLSGWGVSGRNPRNPQRGPFSHLCGKERWHGHLLGGGITAAASQRPPPALTKVSTSDYHTCGVKRLARGLLRGSSGVKPGPPPAVPLPSRAGNYHSCGMKSDNTVAGWGRDD